MGGWGEGARLQVRQTLGAGRLRPEGQLLGKKVLRGLPRHPLKPYTRGLTWRLALTLLLLQSASRLASSMFVSVFVCVFYYFLYLLPYFHVRYPQILSPLSSSFRRVQYQFPLDFS